MVLYSVMEHLCVVLNTNFLRLNSVASFYISPYYNPLWLTGLKAPTNQLIYFSPKPEEDKMTGLVESVGPGRM